EASREMGPARESFERVLALDPDHPRALLGLARLAIEDGDPQRARAHLRRALEYHRDFPEALALGETIADCSPAAASAAPVGSGGFRVAAGGRDAILVGPDGRAVFAECDPSQQAALIRHLDQVARMASATLARAGLGALRRGAVAGAREATYVEADGASMLSLTLPADTAADDGLAELGRLRSQHAAAPLAAGACPAGAGRPLALGCRGRSPPPAGRGAPPAPGRARSARRRAGRDHRDA